MILVSGEYLDNIFDFIRKNKGKIVAYRSIENLSQIADITDSVDRIDILNTGFNSYLVVVRAKMKTIAKLFGSGFKIGIIVNDKKETYKKLLDYMLFIVSEI